MASKEINALESALAKTNKARNEMEAQKIFREVMDTFMATLTEKKQKEALKYVSYIASKEEEALHREINMLKTQLKYFREVSK